jgi:hypothetical protein
VEAPGQLALAGPVGGSVEGADDLADGGVDLVAAAEGDLEELGQVVDARGISGGPAEGSHKPLATCPDLLGSPGHRNHACIVPAFATPHKHLFC